MCVLREYIWVWRRVTLPYVPMRCPRHDNSFIVHYCHQFSKQQRKVDINPNICEESSFKNFMVTKVRRRNWLCTQVPLPPSPLCNSIFGIWSDSELFDKLRTFFPFLYMQVKLLSLILNNYPCRQGNSIHILSNFSSLTILKLSII